MLHVCNDPDLMRELERHWRAFRETVSDGAARLERRLELDLGRSWRDRRFDDYRERFGRDIELLLRAIDDSASLEAVAAHLRVRLEEYLGDGSAPASVVTRQDSGGSDFLVEVAREVLKRLLVRGTVEAILRWFREHPFIAQGFAELLRHLCTVEAARQVILLLVLRELLFPGIVGEASSLPPSSVADARNGVSQLLDSTDAKVRAASADLLGRMRGGDLERLAALTRDSDPEVTSAATRALGSITGQTDTAVATLRDAATSENPSVRRSAVDALATSRTPEAAVALAGLAMHSDIVTRRHANGAAIENESQGVLDRMFDGLQRVSAPTGASSGGGLTMERAARASRLLASLVVSANTGNDLLLVQPILAMLSPDATLATIAAARTAVDDGSNDAATFRGSAWKPSGRPKIQAGLAATVMASAVTQRGPLDQKQLNARQPFVRAAANGAAAVRAHQVAPDQAVTFARQAVVAARQSNDRGFLAMALAILADTLMRIDRCSEALTMFAAAYDATVQMSVVERQEWSGTPIALAIALGRASAYARTLAADDHGIMVGLLCELFLGLLRMLSLGYFLTDTAAGVLIQRAIADLCGTYAAEKRSPRDH
jgi:hypothetical protein